MVTPPALIAATPVGATTAICLGQFSLIYFRNVVLPVPALPVRKIFLELWFTSSAANRNISLLRSYSILVIIYQIKKLRLLTRAFQWCGAGSNRRHKDFQSFALPTELPHLLIPELLEKIPFMFGAAKIIVLGQRQKKQC